MSIEEIIENLKHMVETCDAGGTVVWDKWIEAAREAIALLRTHPDAQPNEPLTLEELKQMYCQAVWVQYEDSSHGSWGLVELDRITLPAGAYCIIQEEGFGKGWRAYRRPPKED